VIMNVMLEIWGTSLQAQMVCAVSFFLYEFGKLENQGLV
jgi:hypothetical protein